MNNAPSAAAPATAPEPAAPAEPLKDEPLPEGIPAVVSRESKGGVEIIITEPEPSLTQTQNTTETNNVKPKQVVQERRNMAEPLPKVTVEKPVIAKPAPGQTVGPIYASSGKVQPIKRTLPDAMKPKDSQVVIPKPLKMEDPDKT